jgi:hypothetical protein
MRRMVVSTSSGEYIREADMDEQQLVASVVTLSQVLPELGIYIDGHLVTPEVRQAMTAALAAAATSAASEAPLPEPARLKEYSETLKQSFADLHQGYVQFIRDTQEWARRSGELLIERERQFADEAVRQRKLTGQSLADIDLLGRSIKAVQFQDRFAGTGSNIAARANKAPAPVWVDFLGGLMRAVAGEK